MNVTMSADTNLLQDLRHNLSRLLTMLPTRRASGSDVQRVTKGSAFEAAKEEAPVEVPLPPCRPLNTAERDEVEMLARIRGALYSKEG
jgi:hypothetical protein